MENIKKNLTRVYSKLSMVDQMMLNNYINNEVKRISVIALEDLTKETDICLSAALIENLPELSQSEIRDIIDKAIEYGDDLTEKSKKLKKEYGKEINKYVDKVGNQIIERVKQIVKEGLNQNAALRLLKNEFKGIPQATLINYYKDVKEECRANKDKTKAIPTSVEEAAEYILEESQKTTKDNVQEENLKEVKVNVPAPRKDINIEILKHKEIYDLQGEYDKYHVEDGKVTTEKYTFENTQDIVDTYCTYIINLKKEIQLYENKFDEAMEVFNRFANY